jgi:hypothetical protein
VEGAAAGPGGDVTDCDGDADAEALSTETFSTSTPICREWVGGRRVTVVTGRAEL